MDKIDQFKIKNQDLAESFMPGRDKVFGAILGAAKQHAEQKGKRDQLRSLLEGGTMAAMDTGKVEMRKAPGAKKAEEALSTAADFIPFVGAGKSAMQGDYGSAALQAGMDVAGGSLLKGAAALGGKAIPALAGIFIGPKAKTWNKAAADEFNRLVDEGEDWNKAHGKTGTHFGADSALRQEISDKNMRLRSQAELDAMAQQKRIELSALESAMRFNKTGQRDLFPRELSAARAELRPRRLELETDIDLLRADPSRTGYPLRLVMEHPELYKAYPNIGDDVMVRRGNDLGKGVYGEVVMGPSGRTIGLSRLSESPNAKIKPEDTMVHELQHVIQDIEGFEGGSSPRDALNLMVGARIRELQAQGMSPKDATAEASKEFSGRAGELYSRMAGEAEARAVEARRQMTPEERLATHPQDQDYDNYVPYDRQLMQRDYQPYAHGGEVHAANGLPLTFAYDKPDPDALQNWMRENQFGKVDIPAPYKVTPEEVTVARAMRTPAPEMSAKDKLRTLLQEGVKQGKKEVKTLGDPNAVTDLVNRGLIANNPVSGAIDLVNMGLEPFGLGSEMPIGGSAHVQKLMKDYGFTKQERPLLETGLALASPFAPSAAKKVGQLAKDTAPAAREALHGALESGMESGLIQGPAYAIKPVGGQWLDAPRGNRLGLGNESLAESKTALDRALERVQFGIPEWQELVAAGKFPAHIAEGNINAIRQNLEMAKQSHALNSFTEKQLTNYIRNQMGSPEDPILKLAENWPNERAAMLAERRQRLGALEAKRQAIETNPVPADVRDPAAWRQARIRTIEGEMAGVRESIDNIIEHQPLHMPTSEVGLLTDTATRREKAGFPAHGTATTDIGRGWENLTDRQIKNIEAWKLASSDYLPSLYDADAANLSASIFNKPRPHNLTPQQIQEVRMYRNDPLAQPEFLQENKWLGKLDPGTPIYGLNEPQRVMRALGFDHVMDVLQSDLRSGRIKPEQLNRMSVEDAVRRTAEYNAEKAAAMSKAEATSAANLTPHRDYPGGYRMVQLDKPGQFAKESQLMGHSVEGYEPPPGHPDWVDESLDVGSKLYGATKEGWEGLKSGQTQVFSFRDSKNRPHATLEIKKPGPTYQEMKKIIDGYDMDENAKMDRLFQLGYVDEAGNVLPDKPNEIVQIKGKVNNLVNEDYWPYLQRYVRESGMPVWSDDLNKIGLIDMRGRKLAYTSNPDKVKNIPDYITESERQRLRSAGEFTPDPHFSSPEFASQGMKRGGRVKLGALSLAH